MAAVDVATRLPEGVSPQDVREQLERILCAGIFRRSERLSQFLRFVVEKALRGEEEDIKELVLAAEVFERSPDFDPRLDPIVRVEAGRLRNKIREYYDTIGSNDTLWVGLARRGYKPVIRRRASDDPLEVESESPEAHSSDGDPHQEANDDWPSIAVLPVADFTNGAPLTSLTESLTDQLIQALARSGQWRVAARISTQKFDSIAEDIRDIGHAMDVRYVLEGGLQRRENEVRFRVRLFNTESGLTAWADTLKTVDGDDLEIQDALVEQTIEALKLHRGERQPA